MLNMKKKIIGTSLGAMVALGSLGISAYAADNQKLDKNQLKQEAAKQGVSVKELRGKLKAERTADREAKLKAIA
ncbi:hypothetical protein [Peribacillus kribbensis]|uniref:hypothetical protein n=1 Tax=Peribacillus kribbensis TaxID=356658 RepID=UPI00042A63AA|nr:hypothetical protein [Peribacillus kribbensis]